MKEMRQAKKIGLCWICFSTSISTFCGSTFSELAEASHPISVREYLQLGPKSDERLARLSRAEVVRVATAAAAQNGFDLRCYSPIPDGYHNDTRIWIVRFQEKSARTPSSPFTIHFLVYVNDVTRRASMTSPSKPLFSRSFNRQPPVAQPRIPPV